MLIGISGKKRVGKDTTVNFIKEYYANKNINCKSYAFADDVKKITSKFFNVNLNELNGNKNTVLNYEMTARQMLQFIGDCGRKVDENFWVNRLLDIDYIKNHNNYKYPIIISDVRYKNEADLIKKLGGILIRIERDIPNNDTHISECNLDDYSKFDYNITKYMNHDMMSLKENVFNICSTL